MPGYQGVMPGQRFALLRLVSQPGDESCGSVELERRPAPGWLPALVPCLSNAGSNVSWTDRLRLDAHPVAGMGLAAGDDQGRARLAAAGRFDRIGHRCPAESLRVGGLPADSPAVLDPVNDYAPGALLVQRHLHLVRGRTLTPCGRSVSAETAGLPGNPPGMSASVVLPPGRAPPKTPIRNTRRGPTPVGSQLHCPAPTL